jgi:hypothetical protein
MTRGIYEPAPALSPDEAEHVRTYRKFVRYMRIAACVLPLFVAFLLF